MPDTIDSKAYTAGAPDIEAGPESPEPQGVKLGDYIKELREARGLTKKAVADATGVNWTSVNNWEKWGAVPQRAKLKLLIEKLSLSPREAARLLAIAGEPIVEAATIARDPTPTPPPPAIKVGDEERGALEDLLSAAMIKGRHSFKDAEVAFAALEDAASLISGLRAPEDDARAWLDAAASLRRRGLAVTGAAIAILAIDMRQATPSGVMARARLPTPISRSEDET